MLTYCGNWKKTTIRMYSCFFRLACDNSFIQTWGSRKKSINLISINIIQYLNMIAESWENCGKKLQTSASQPRAPKTWITPVLFSSGSLRIAKLNDSCRSSAEGSKNLGARAPRLFWGFTSGENNHIVVSLLVSLWQTRSGILFQSCV